MTIKTACDCCEQQLNLVGCDCEFTRGEGPLRIVRYWPKGYASEEGPARLEIGSTQNPKDAVRKFAGMWAAEGIISVQLKHPPKVPVEQFSKEYIRMMSRDS